MHFSVRVKIQISCLGQRVREAPGDDAGEGRQSAVSRKRGHADQRRRTHPIAVFQKRRRQEDGSDFSRSNLVTPPSEG